MRANCFWLNIGLYAFVNPSLTICIGLVQFQMQEEYVWTTCTHITEHISKVHTHTPRTTELAEVTDPGLTRAHGAALILQNLENCLSCYGGNIRVYVYSANAYLYAWTGNEAATRN